MAAGLPPIRTEIDAAKEDLKTFGMTRFFGAAAAAEIDTARQRLIDQATAEDAAGVSYRENGLTFDAMPGGANQRVWNLINKGEIFQRLVLNAVARRLVKRLLGPDALLFSISANIACKGGKAQVLHGDQVFAPVTTPYPLITNCLWMLDEFTDENGATRVVPGSHLAGRWPEPEEAIDTFPATGPRGTIMVWDGRLWHGAGVNTTDEPRRGLLAAYCAPFVRQQENATVSLSPEVLETSSDELLTLLGFRSWMGIGSVDGANYGVLRGRPSEFSKPLSACAPAEEPST
jgi:ectoine hydroxylase-related dioxygenase (phytanoyl-CoA dioxygenase family)